MSNGIYVAAKFSRADELWLYNLQKKLNLKNPLPAKDFHCTLVHSTKYDDIVVAPDRLFVARPAGIEVWKTRAEKNAIVLKLDSTMLVERHKHLMRNYDITYDYSEYKPHVTLSYDDEVSEPEKVFIEPAMFMLHKEYREDLELDKYGTS